jgi:hypothetical protein
MNLTSAPFREKSAWITLGVLLVVFIPYFTFIVRLFAAEHLLAGAVLGAFVAATIFMILLEAVFHIALGIFSRSEPQDERDRAIELKSFRVAYGILAVTAFCAIGAIVVLALPYAALPGVPWLAPVFLSQVFFLCFVLAEVGKYLTQAICYRRGS